MTYCLDFLISNAMTGSYPDQKPGGEGGSTIYIM